MEVEADRLAILMRKLLRIQHDYYAEFVEVVTRNSSTPDKVYVSPHEYAKYLKLLFKLP